MAAPALRQPGSPVPAPTTHLDSLVLDNDVTGSFRSGNYWISLVVATMMQSLDFSQARSSKKWTANSKRQPGQGFDAPRNSMEFAMKAPHNYGVFQEDIPHSCNNMRQYPKSSAPIKKLIHEDASFRPNEGHNRVTSIIARLMGMDSPPIMSDVEFDKLKLRLKQDGSNIVTEGPGEVYVVARFQCYHTIRSVFDYCYMWRSKSAVNMGEMYMSQPPSLPPSYEYDKN